MINSVLNVTEEQHVIPSIVLNSITSAHRERIIELRGGFKKIKTVNLGVWPKLGGLVGG